MTKVLVWVFSMAMVSLFFICDSGQAQELPTQPNVSSYQGVDCQAKQPQRSSQNRVNRGAAENRGQRIPKPERNRLAEVKSKKAKRLRKRKKSYRSTNSHKHKANRKTTALLVEDTHKASNTNNDTVKEQSIKTKRIDANHYKNDKEDLLNYDDLSIESTWSEEEFDGIRFGDKRIDMKIGRIPKQPMACFIMKK